jgi:putative transposase
MVNIKLQINQNSSLSDLYAFYRKEKDSRIKERSLILIHSKEGKTTREIGKIVKKSPTTVAMWIRRFNKFGFNGLKDVPKSGRPKRMNDESFNEIKHDLAKSPETFGYDKQFWCPKLLRIHIEKNYNALYTERHSARIMRKFNYTLIKPRTTDIRKNPADKQGFREKLKKTSKHR